METPNAKPSKQSAAESIELVDQDVRLADGVHRPRRPSDGADGETSAASSKRRGPSFTQIRRQISQRLFGVREVRPNVQRAPIIEYPFYLISSIQVEELDDRRERAKLKIFTKWHIPVGNFPQQLRDHTKADNIKISCGAPPGSEVYENIVAQLVKGKMVKKCSLDEHYFPVNPGNVFANRVEMASEERVLDLQWIKYEKVEDATKMQGVRVYVGGEAPSQFGQLIIEDSEFPMDAEEAGSPIEFGVVSVQMVFRATLKCTLNMAHFPYDRHIIPACILARSRKVKLPDKSKVKLQWVLSLQENGSPPPWVHLQYPEDKYVVSEINAWVDDSDEFQHLKPFVYITAKSKLVLCLRIERNPTHFILSVCVPVCALVLLCMASFFLGFNNASARLQSVLISALSTVAFRTAIRNQIPTKAYMNTADWYFTGIFCYLALFVLKIVMVYQGQADDGVGLFWYDHNEAEDGNDFRRTEKLYQFLDDLSSWMLTGIWLMIHILLILDTKFKFLGKYLHPTWAKLFDSIPESPDQTNHGINKVSNPGIELEKTRDEERRDEMMQNVNAAQETAPSDNLNNSSRFTYWGVPLSPFSGLISSPRWPLSSREEAEQNEGDSSVLVREMSSDSQAKPEVLHVLESKGP